MTKVRLLLLLLTIALVGGLLAVFGLYARGYRFNLEELKFVPSGILVLKSDPDGAQIFVNGELKTATNATISLRPGIYDISVRKEGYLAWNKRLTIEKEVVTEAEAHLFRSAPSLSAITFSGVVKPSASDDFTKIAFAVPPEGDNGAEKSGLWVIETVNLPLGFARDPKRISDGNLINASWQWSPDGRELLVTTVSGSYLLDAGEFTPQRNWVNISGQKTEILANWEEEKVKKLDSQLKNVPDKLSSILKESATNIYFSPDEKRVLYTATHEETIPENLIAPIPGASTQAEERSIKEGRTYVYDIKEDRNFLVAESLSGKKMAWYASSNHLLVAENTKIVIMDFDSTNAQVVYSGSYEAPNAFPTLNEDRIMVLTNLGAGNNIPNLYSLSLK